MRRTLVPLLLLLAMSTSGWTQEVGPGTTQPRRSLIGRIFNPFGWGTGERLPEYKDARLRGLVLSLALPEQPIRLSETRQMDVRVRLTNRSKRPVTLEFADSQRIEIFLRNTAEQVLTTWSDNHAFNPALSTVLINPQEHIEYSETIATRELTPNRVFICEVFFVKYPELRLRQKFLTAP
ncbi:hypothetical protein BH20VER1_BH20VER1_01880 [soil metagenome]